MNLHPMTEDWSSLSEKLRLPGCPVEGNILKGYQRLDERTIACHNCLWELNWASSYYVTGPHSANRTLDKRTQGPQCLPQSSQSLERNRNILLSHPHLDLHRHLTPQAPL